MDRVPSKIGVAVSVVIPCYNEEQGLPYLISNIQWLASELPDWEFVLVDNGSSDNSFVIMRDLTDKYRQIRVKRVEENIGYGHGILSGLSLAEGRVLGWFHADLQVGASDILAMVRANKIASRKDAFFLKGLRSNRSFIDTVFTLGMSCFESLLFRTSLWDINAQPTFFSRQLYETWADPPYDFSLDLYAYVMARRNCHILIRHRINQIEREYGESSWNSGLMARLKLTIRTVGYSFKLYKELK